MSVGNEQKRSWLSKLLPSFIAPSPSKEVRDRTLLLSQFNSDNWPSWGVSSASGQTVNQTTALSIPAFYRGVQIIADTIASLKIEVQQVDSEGNITVLQDHPVAKLLNEPSPRYSKFTFRSTMQAYSLIQGNAYAFISRDRTGRAIELRIVAPDKVKPYLNKKGELLYQITEKNKVEVVEFTDVLHIPSLVLNEDHIKGISPIQYFRNTLGLPLAMIEWSGKTFQDGSPLQGLLSTEREMTPTQIGIAQKQWKDQLAKGSTPILPGGLKYQGVTLTPEDMLFIDSYKLSVEDISRIVGVPLHMLSSLDRATFSNIEEQSRGFVQDTIRPWVKRHEAEYSRKLLSEREKPTTRIRFVLESLLRGSMQTQAEFISKMVLNGVMSRNEGRKYLGMNTKEGLDEMPMPVQFQQNNDE